MAPAAAAATVACAVAGNRYREDVLMLDKLLALLTPQAVKDRIAALEAEVAALSAWKTQVEAVWPQIVEVIDGTD